MPPDLATLRQRLAAALGDDAVAAGTPADAVAGAIPPLVARPASEEQVAAVAAACRAAGAAMLPRGGGTVLETGHPPARAGVLVSLERLARVVEHDRANLTLTVEAGVRLLDVQRTLNAAAQQLPLDPPRPEQVTLGGLLAANQSGPARLLRGTARDWVVGMRVVLASGERLALGGRVIKNVSGYDMSKLFIGSFGTLGILTQATFKLLPRPAVRAGVLTAFADASRAGDLVAKVLASVLLPEAIELLDPAAMSVIPGAEATPRAWGLAFALAGGQESVERQRRDLVGLARAAGAHADWLIEPARLDEIWQRVRSLPDTLSGGAPRLAFRVGVPIARGVELAEVARETAAALGVQAVTVAHAGSGIVRAAWRLEGGAARPEPVADALEGLRQRAESHDGWLVLTGAPPAFRTLLDPWGKPADGCELMRRLKAELDPEGLMSPGRFVGGL